MIPHLPQHFAAPRLGPPRGGPARAPALRVASRYRASAPHDALAQNLARPIPAAPGLGVFGTLVAAVPTFGLLPALVWPVRWAAFVGAEREQYQMLAEWVRLNARHPAADKLGRRAAALRPSGVLALLPVVASLCTAGVFLLAFAAPGGASLLDCTYQFLPAARAPSAAGPAGVDVPWAVFLAWAGLLSVGYFAQWLQVHVHARNVRRFLDDFNQVVVHDALAPVFLPPVGTGVRPLWTLGALALIGISAPWGIPLMLAGAVRRRYAQRAGPAARAAVASRLLGMMASRRPAFASQFLVPPAPRLRCPTKGCRLPLPAGARFCPRCGSHPGSPLDQVP